MDINFFTFPIEVDYPEHYPSFNYIRNSLNKSELTIQFIFGTKPHYYNYEQEVRIIKEQRTTKNYRGQFKIKKDALVEVIFGYKTSIDQKNSIYDLLKSTGYNPSFFETSLKDTDFGLDKKNYCR